MKTLLLYTLLIAFDRPGHMHGQLRVCVRADSLPAADARAEGALEETVRGAVLTSVTTIPDCPWMPNDLEDAR